MFVLRITKKIRPKKMPGVANDQSEALNAGPPPQHADPEVALDNERAARGMAYG
jgi:hypothetical protein